MVVGDAPYVRIAGELRERIEAGELAPGDRVPSTRELMRQWGVAMATATRALSTLRQEGLVRAVTGVGTLVAGPAAGPAPGSASDPAPTRSRTHRPVAARPRRREAGEPGLALGQIVTTAVAVADAEGLAALSMRRVAADLGVATMSLYRHVEDKDDLLLRMMDAALREWPVPDTPPGGWRPRLELVARTLWKGFRAHPWLAPALSLTRPQPVAGGMAYTEFVLAALDGRGLSPQEMLGTQLMLFNYVRGTAFNLELEADAEAASGLSSDEWIDSQEPAMLSIVAGGGFPQLAKIMAAEFDLDLDVLFETGLRHLLDGLALELDGRTT